MEYGALDRQNPIKQPNVDFVSQFEDIDPLTVTPEEELRLVGNLYLYKPERFEEEALLLSSSLPLH